MMRIRTAIAIVERPEGDKGSGLGTGRAPVVRRRHELCIGVSNVPGWSLAMTPYDNHGRRGGWHVRGPDIVEPGGLISTAALLTELRGFWVRDARASLRLMENARRRAIDGAQP